MKSPISFRSSSLLACLSGLALITLLVYPASAQDDAPTLAAKLAAGIEDGDSATRLRMKIKSNSGGGDVTMQIQIKARRSEGSAAVVYQMFYPKERMGESFLLQGQKGGSAKGYAFTPPATSMVTLSKSQLSDPAFGSDLAYQDVIENFFRWKDQQLAGNETVDRVDCVILDSKPGSSDSTPYGRVRSWIDTRRMIAMKVEKYDSSDNLVRKIVTTRVARDDNGRDVSASLLVTRPGSSTTTEIEGSDVRHDVDFADRDFTAEAIADFTVPR